MTHGCATVTALNCFSELVAFLFAVNSSGQVFFRAQPKKREDVGRCVLRRMLTLGLIFAMHGMAFADPTTDPLPPFQFPPEAFALCCDLSAGLLEEEVENSSRAAHREHAKPAQCSTSLQINQTKNLGEFCFNLQCWVDGAQEHLICRLEPSAGWLGTGRLLTMSLECLQSGGAGNGTPASATMQQLIEGEVILRCSLPPHAMGRSVSVAVSVSSGQRMARTPAIHLIPKHLVKPGPPINLKYNMSMTGELMLSWTDPQPASGPLTYHIRYSPNVSLRSWVHVDGVRSQPVPLAGVAAGVTYVVQVRCISRDVPSPWSDWSQAVLIYLHDVTYLPETTLASAGSNVTVHCIFNNRSLRVENTVWWLNVHQKIPESQYSVLNDHVSRVTVLNMKPSGQLPFSTLQCCQQDKETSHCGYSYASVYIMDVSVTISCETNGDLTAMTCRWSSDQWEKFLYRIGNLPCALAEEDESMSPVEECPVAGQDFRGCTLQPLLPIACYKIWLEFGEATESVQSHPIYVTPMEVVKPYPPYHLVATLVPEGYLNIGWKKHRLPVYELQSEVRYAVDRPDPQWKVSSSVSNQSLVVPVPDPCVTYLVQVRSRRFSGPGLWSNWSDRRKATIFNSRAPQQGPDFWRELHQDPARNQTNVTLLFKPLKREPLLCVEGLAVEHRVSGVGVWSKQLGLHPSHTFAWTGEAHTVTGLALNALGSSTRNTNMTLTRTARRLGVVSSFSLTRVNSSWVALAWTLNPESPTPLSLVLEWRGQNRSLQRENRGDWVRWARLPTSSSSFYVYDNSDDSEDYNFILYPIYANEEGEPVYTKEEKGLPRRQQAGYAILLIITVLSCILLLTLAISQHQMTLLAWRDVPNPNNCSWAQGVDLKNVETMENLFKHNEGLTSRPLLLDSALISEVEIVEKKTRPLSQGRGQDWPLNREDPLTAAPPTVCTPAECSAERSLAYATVLPPQGLALCDQPQESLGSCPDEGTSSGPRDPWELGSGSSYCSYDSAETFSGASGQEDGLPGGSSKRIGLAFQDQEGEAKEEKLLRPAALTQSWGIQEERPLESLPLLCHQGSGSNCLNVQVVSIPSYIPQVQSVSSKTPGASAAERFLELLELP